MTEEKAFSLNVSFEALEKYLPLRKLLLASGLVSIRVIRYTPLPVNREQLASLCTAIFRISGHTHISNSFLLSTPSGPDSLYPSKQKILEPWAVRLGAGGPGASG